MTYPSFSTPTQFLWVKKPKSFSVCYVSDLRHVSMDADCGSNPYIDVLHTRPHSSHVLPLLRSRLRQSRSVIPFNKPVYFLLFLHLLVLKSYACSIRVLRSIHLEQRSPGQCSSSKFCFSPWFIVADTVNRYWLRFQNRPLHLIPNGARFPSCRRFIVFGRQKHRSCSSRHPSKLCTVANKFQR